MTAIHALEARNISKRYGDKKALDGVSIDVAAGRIHVLLGRNGSGKTTLAKVLAGIMRPDSGTICSDGMKVATCDRGYRGRVGFLFDNSVHWDSLTGRENAWFFARAFGLGPSETSERIGSLFDQLSIADVADDLVSTYSFGMKRKLALVQALVHNPEILILDEPSIGLDYASRITIYTMLRARASSGLSIVIATNDMNEARYLADTVSLIDRGKVLVTGAPAELVKSLNKDVLIQVELRIPVREDAVRSLPGVVNATVQEDKDTVRLNVLAAANDELLVTRELLRFLSEREAGFSKLDLCRPELGDVFLKYMRGEQR